MSMSTVTRFKKKMGRCVSIYVFLIGNTRLRLTILPPLTLSQLHSNNKQSLRYNLEKHHPVLRQLPPRRPVD